MSKTVIDINEVREVYVWKKGPMLRLVEVVAVEDQDATYQIWLNGSLAFGGSRYSNQQLDGRLKWMNTIGELRELLVEEINLIDEELLCPIL